MLKIPSSEITPRHVYLSRRQFIQGAGTIAAGALALAACRADDLATDLPEPASTQAVGQATPEPEVLKDELGDPANSFEDITHYNNYYEFSTNKEAVARAAKDLVTSPWQIEVGGLVNNPKTYDLDALRAFQQEERIYRLRCVEGWSMVIPWQGFPLWRILQEVEPKSEATHVKFTTLFDPEQMPGESTDWLTWPYVEGLRLDEAMHDLTILATGLYGEYLLPQSGAPVRLVVPWKYGFKSIKAIVSIHLVSHEPASLWMLAAPDEYGFYANVNPHVDHPRWSQATERRIGELGRRKTLMFNGYGDQVAYLYSGQDLRKDF